MVEINNPHILICDYIFSNPKTMRKTNFRNYIKVLNSELFENLKNYIL